ncbi:TIGR02996 domain-containing protein [Tuwongella immobilis]|uniref:Repeat-companion domain protein n=1 Tax=Tuwongella immobilis TaxID=692036 RepID=A0A6C2YJM9_9BACT|nr:TIGR02996 domain-containing protein [Tuwongella immobilis]VIP01313.1 Leucine-rich repeat, typical subtype-like protein OS=Naegleria gruberi GN=NAEGRDRAFT_46752 PE=4 SV=1: LRR_6: LRR_6 [Tuwongella immobilis]VTR98052.1 Leucine-rich repeat, typical subtype-like protein OS=Naegleria gruberi GN=NAEGRDRAFT_46752 PE=4 SV=1: LRR_6: LRR_6 [Tuwongella immobilis]
MIDSAAALLAAIRESPNELLPRLAFADWCEEHQQPERAAFIREQCAAAAGASPYDPQARQFQQSAALRLHAHSAEWYPQLSHATRSQLIHERGFPIAVRINPLVLPADLPILIQQTPLERLSIDCSQVEMPAIVEQILRRLSVMLQGSRLRTLELLNAGMNSRSLAPLLEISELVTLESLNLLRNHADSRFVDQLLASPRLPRLRQLDLESNSLTPEGIRQLLTRPSFAKLRAFHIPDQNIDHSTWMAMLESPHATELESLSLGPGLDSRCLIRWTQHDGLPALRHLDLAWNDIHDPAVIQLAESPRLRQLQSLSLWATPITEAAGQALARSRFADHLRLLDLSRTGIRDETILAMLSTGTWTNLRELRLERIPLQMQTLRHLAESNRLSPDCRLMVTTLHLSRAESQQVREWFDARQKLAESARIPAGLPHPD